MRKVDLTSKVFGKLKVIKEEGKDKWGKITYTCRCECGNEKTVLGRQLTLGRAQSCGCLQKERASKANTKHDLRGTRIYRAWRTVRDKESTGLFVESSWKDIKAFIKDVGDMPSDKHMISRRDLAVGFTKDNTFWDITFKKINYDQFIGNKYGWLTVISKGENNKHGTPTLKCLCECGNTHKTTKYSLINGETKSCGCLDPKVSFAEIEIGDFIESLGFKVIRNSRSLFANSSKEADIFIPSKKLIVEYDGSIWHSTKFAHSKHNVLEKTELANKNGYSCMHIRDDQYLHNPGLVKNLIKARLGIFEHSIGARKTTKKNITNFNYSILCKENHLQGYRAAEFKKGLYYNDELIAAIGYDKKGELIRYVVKNGWQVLGALPKLIKNEAIKYSFCDLTFFTGNSYPKAGFVLDKTTKPNYRYVKGASTVSRNSMMKHMLKDKFTNFDESLTEEQNCANNGWYRLYDCGNAKYIISQ